MPTPLFADLNRHHSRTGGREVSGQFSEADRPADSRFFSNPLEVKQMIAQLRGIRCAGYRQEYLTAENDSLRA